jgi:MEMO1 family protein
MRTIVVYFLSIIFTMNMFGQGRPGDREPYAAGKFYSDNAETLKHDLAVLFSSAAQLPEDGEVRAIIVPHAGYVFSGKTAATAYKTVPAGKHFSNIFIIGSSHTMAFDGASVYSSGDFKTPLGTVKVNKEIAAKLNQSGRVFGFPENSHWKEHSLEVQLPFIQYYFSPVPEIVPIVIGTDNPKTVRSVAEALRPYFTPDNLFIISSDFSHYPAYADAVQIDSLTAAALMSKDPEKFLSALRDNAAKEIPGLATSMCGWTSGLALLYLINGSKELELRKVDYSNSGDSKYSTRDEVVGYNALVLSGKSNGIPMDEPKNKGEVSFTKAEKDMLFGIARSSIETMLQQKKRFIINRDTVTSGLQKKMGAFVTLKIGGNLRGCIGRFISEEPLYQVVNEMATASAFDDNRFDPLSKEEYPKLEIEISVLGPLKKINSISEIVPGLHGIYIKKDGRSGTMLPQVLTENHWTLEQFLGYTSRDKAGIGWDGWKSAELYIYEAVVLEENK